MWDSDKLTWFDNPPKRKRKLYGAAAKAHARKVGKKRRHRKGARHVAKRRGHRRKLYGAAAKAHARRMARGGSHRRRSTHRARPRRRHYRRSSAVAASRAGRTLRYRRPNPPFKGIVGQLIGGVQDASFIVLGKAGTNIVAGFIPLGGGVALETAKKLASALVVGYVGNFISANAGRMMLAGGLAGLVEGVVKQLNIPLIAPALSDYSAFPAVGAYPQVSPGVSAYPQLMAGEDDMLYSLEAD